MLLQAVVLYSVRCDSLLMYAVAECGTQGGIAVLHKVALPYLEVGEMASNLI